MTIRASGRSALILATGLLVCFAAPPQAAAKANDAAASARPEATGAPVSLHKSARSGSRHWKKYAHRRSGKVALKSAGDKKADASDDGDRASAIPPSVANANAELTSDTPTGNAARAMAARASDMVQAAPDQPGSAQPAADTQLVAADQLNDVDRALQSPASANPPIAAMATASAAPAAAGSDNSAWDQTSLIGKIFIGFGALLTMASAARMFMA